MRIETLYEPSPWGEEFHSLTVDEALGAGAAGVGKSTVLRVEPLVQAMVEHDRCRLPYDPVKNPHPLKWGESVGWALYMRRTRPRQLQNISIAQRLYRAVDPQVVWKEKEGIFVFQSGYKVQYGSCMDPDDWQNYYSNEYTLILFDELVEFLEEQYIQITSRLRTADPILKHMLKIRSMSNPVQRAESGVVTRDPFWVRRYFVDAAPEGRKVLKKRIVLGDGTVKYLTRIYLPGTLRDNPNKEFAEQYETNLRNKPTHMQKALIDGDWYVTAGSYYADAWNPQYNICRPFTIPGRWTRFRSLDWGFKTHGTIGWFAQDPDGNLFCEYEYNFIGKLVPEVASDVKRIEIKLGLWKFGRSQITGPADTQLWEERGDKGLSKIQEFVKAGVSWVQADKSKGSRQRHAERITARLKDHRDGTTTAGLVFFDTCKKCIQTLPAIQADPTNIESVVKGGEDHWHDMVSYAVSFASKGTVGDSVDDIHSKIAKIEDDFEENRELDRGSTGYGV